jgi:hypothetical protein
MSSRTSILFALGLALSTGACGRTVGRASCPGRQRRRARRWRQWWRRQSRRRRGQRARRRGQHARRRRDFRYGRGWGRRHANLDLLLPRPLPAPAAAVLLRLHRDHTRRHVPARRSRLSEQLLRTLRRYLRLPGWRLLPRPWRLAARDLLHVAGGLSGDGKSGVHLQRRLCWLGRKCLLLRRADTRRQLHNWLLHPLNTRLTVSRPR